MGKEEWKHKVKIWITVPALLQVSAPNQVLELEGKMQGCKGSINSKYVDCCSKVVLFLSLTVFMT